MGTPDGTSLSNLFIDDLSDEGVVFVDSNGNNGDSDFHIQHEFSGEGDAIRSRSVLPCPQPERMGSKLDLVG